MSHIIITHPGSAHRDEFIASCLLIAEGKVDRVERRDPTDEDLNDPNVIVLDQGSRHEPELLNFDHHQFDRDADPACSITLILPFLGIDVGQARSIWDWLEFSELLDSKGPYATAELLGSTPDALHAGVSPVETTVLRWFEEESFISNPSKTIAGYDADSAPLYALMHRIGREKLDYLNEVVERHLQLDAEAKGLCINSKCDGSYQGYNLFNALDATCIDRDENPVMGLESWIGDDDVAVTITQDDRGDGLCLFRRNDDPRVDFSRIEGEGGVLFAHKGGFVAKIERGVDPLHLIYKAFTG